MLLVVQVKITAYACSLSHGTGQETLLLLHTDFSLTLITEWIQDYSEAENEGKGEYILAHVNVQNRPVRSLFIFLLSSLQMRDPSASLPYPSECLSLRSLDVLRRVSLPHSPLHEEFWGYKHVNICRSPKLQALFGHHGTAECLFFSFISWQIISGCSFNKGRLQLIDISWHKTCFFPQKFQVRAITELSLPKPAIAVTSIVA